MIQVHDKHERWAKDNFKNPNSQKSRKGAKSYRYCKRHDKVEPVSSRCFKDVRVIGKSAAVHTYATWTNTILDDAPIRIESKRQHRLECSKRGILCPE